MAAVVEPGGRGAIVAGEAGVGKSHLLERAAGLLALQGWAPLRVRGDRARTTPFAAVGTLLPPLEGDPKRWAVMLRRGLDHLVEQARPSRALLVADDLQAFDPASATLVQHAVVEGRVRLIGTLHSGDVPPDAVTALWKEDVVERLELGPLARQEVDELLEQLMDGPVDAETRSRMWHWVEGNPLLLTEVVEHTRWRAAWRRTAGLWHLDHDDGGEPVQSPMLAAILRERMTGVPPGVADAVDILALAGHLPLGVLDHLVGHRALALAERQRLTRTYEEPAGRVLTLDHPLYGELRRAELGAARKDDLRGRVLDVFERQDDVAASQATLLARWYLETGRAGERAEAVLIRGAELAWAGNDPRTAAKLARRARQLGSDDRSSLILLRALARLGGASELREVADEVQRTTASDDVRAEAVRHHALFLFEFANRPDAAEAFLLDAMASFDEEARQRHLLIKQAALFRLLQGDLAGAEVMAQPLLTSGDPASVADAAAVFAPVRLLHGQIGESLALSQHALSLIAAPGVAADGPTVGEHIYHQLGAWVEADRLRQAHEMAQSAIAALDKEPDPLSRAFVALQVGGIARLRGRPRTAARWFREAAAGFDAIHRDGFVAWGLAGLTDVQAQVGDLEGARASAEQHRERRDHPIGLAAGEVARALAWELVVGGSLDEAADAFTAAARRSLEAGESLYAAHALHDLVRIGCADQAAAGLEDLAALSDSQLLASFERHAVASVAANLDALESVARRFASMGCDLFAAEAWSEVAKVAKTSGQPRRSVAAHRQVLAFHPKCEGARTPLLATPIRVIDLSRREREIAQLARSGMRRREIAEHLVISPRTVDSHLQRVYRKLGVGDRHGLDEALSEDLDSTGLRADYS